MNFGISVVMPNISISIDRLVDWVVDTIHKFHHLKMNFFWIWSFSLRHSKSNQQWSKSVVKYIWPLTLGHFFPFGQSWIYLLWYALAMVMVTVSCSAWFGSVLRSLTTTSVQATSSVSATVVDKRHWRGTFGRAAAAAAAQQLWCHRDFGRCTRSMVDVGVLSHMPLIWCGADLAMWPGLVNAVARWRRRAFDWSLSMPMPYQEKEKSRKIDIQEQNNRTVKETSKC